VGFPKELEHKLGRVPDAVLAKEAGVSEAAIRKQRKKRGIEAFSKAPTYKPDTDADTDADTDDDGYRPPADVREHVHLERIPFLEKQLGRVLFEVNPFMPGYASAMKLAASWHAELLAERKAMLPPPERQSPEEMIEDWRRECPLLPDQLLELAVDAYLKRHKLELVPRPPDL
jgi:hypothetical protein